MSVRTEAQEYYEAQLQKKVLYIPNLTIYLDKLHQQILKLPHEMLDEKFDQKLGQTREDIINSFCNGVDVLYVILGPIRSMINASAPDYEMKWDDSISKDFPTALQKLGWCYQLMEDADILNDRSISIEIPGEGEGYDDTPSNTDMPASTKSPDDATVGQLDGKDKEPLDASSVSQAI